jgi:hypothetical protein
MYLEQSSVPTHLQPSDINDDLDLFAQRYDENGKLLQLQEDEATAGMNDE